MSKFFDKILETILVAEKEFGAGEGKSKKEMVVNTVNKVVDIPVIPELIEKKIFDVIVDLIVFIFNKYKLWDKQ